MFERVQLRTFVAATGNENKLIYAGILRLLQFIGKCKLEDTLPNNIIILGIILTTSLSNTRSNRKNFKLMLIKTYLSYTKGTLGLKDVNNSPLLNIGYPAQLILCLLSLEH